MVRRFRRPEKRRSFNKWGIFWLFLILASLTILVYSVYSNINTKATIEQTISKDFGNYLNIKLSAKSFVPDENITVHVKYGGKKDTFIKKGWTTRLFFSDSYLTNNKINNDEPEKSGSSDSYSDQFLKVVGMVKLSPTSSNDIYEGQSEIFYKLEGNHAVYFHQYDYSNPESKMVVMDSLPFSIKIPSHIEPLNMRYNNIFIILSILGLIISAVGGIKYNKTSSYQRK